MKIPRIAMIITSALLAIVSIAATKPLRFLNIGYVQTADCYGNPLACITVETPCFDFSSVRCTTYVIAGVPYNGVPLYVFVNPTNPAECVVALHKTVDK